MSDKLLKHAKLIAAAAYQIAASDLRAWHSEERALVTVDDPLANQWLSGIVAAADKLEAKRSRTA